MKKLVFILFLSLLIALSNKSMALEFGRNLPGAAKDMEFFYLHKHSEALPGIIKTFDKNNCFQRSEIRFITAAFLAEIYKNAPKEGEALFSLQKNASYDAKRMFIWAEHLAGLKPKLCTLPQALQKQIALTPSSLEEWDTLQSPSVAYMICGAYFASGKTVYLDKLFSAVKTYATLQSQGLVHDPKYPLAKNVCAILYDMAQKHPSIKAYMIQKKEGAPSDVANVLSSIIAAK